MIEQVPDLFFDAIALGVLGIGCLLDSMLHAKNL